MIFGIIFSIILALILIFLGFSYYAYRVAFYSSPKKRNKLLVVPKSKNEEPAPDNKLNLLVKEMEDIPFEQVYITSFDNLKLSGRYYQVGNNKTLHIQFHGYRGSAVRDFSGGNKLAREAGYNTLVIEQRAHGKSDGKTITFGINESLDCLSWIDYAINRFGNDIKIVISGVSMGASTVLIASQYDLPKNVIGIIADCPFSSPKDIILKVAKDQMHYPPALVYPVIKFSAKFYGKFDIEKTSAIEAVKNAKVPILLIHGEEDDFVPPNMSDKIHKNIASYCRYETFEKAGHGMSYVVDTDRYKNIVDEFMNYINA